MSDLDILDKLMEARSYLVLLNCGNLHLIDDKDTLTGLVLDKTLPILEQLEETFKLKNLRDRLNNQYEQ